VWVCTRLCKLQKGCTRLAAASDKVYQLLAHGRWFSPGTPASSTTKTGRHDIAESGVKHQKIKSNQPMGQNGPNLDVIFLDGLLLKLCPVTLPYIQYDCHCF
jgi:hypothetical protein